MAISKLKKINFSPKEILERVLVSNKVSLGEKNYKYFIGYFCNDNKIKPLHITFSKTSAYVKSYDGKT